MKDSTKSSPMLADLGRSGDRDRLAEAMRTVELTAAETKELCGKDFASYKIPYHDFDGVDTGFYRLRLVGEGPFHAQPEQRYWQPPNSQPRVYLAPGFDWLAVAKDPKVTLVITEGEKKAAAACLKGIVTLGLGGVWSWRSKKGGVLLLPDLAAFDCKARTVELTFDSDSNNRNDLLAALYALANELERRGAIVVRVALPQLPAQEKTGLDDFLKVRSVDDFRALPRVKPPLTAALHALNADYAVLDEPHGEIFWVGGRCVVARDKFLTATADHKVPGFDARNRAVQLHAGQEWIGWHGRRCFSRRIYAPRAPGIDVQQGDEFNLWTGWGVQARRGSTELWRESLAYLISDPALRAWVECWLAYPLQYPGTKLYTALVLWGGSGVGKSLMGYTMREIYGADNFAEITQQTLSSPFNSWAACKQFILAEEVGSTQRRADADELKHVITQQTLLVNEKHQPRYRLDDLTNYLLTSNHPDPIKIDDDERRYLIVRVPDKPLSRDFYKRYDDWYRSADVGALFYRLLNDVDTSAFDPRAPAPDTEDKFRVAALKKSDLELFLERAADDYDAVFRVGNMTTPCDLQSPGTLLKRFMDEQPPNVQLGDYKTQLVGKIMDRLHNRVSMLPRTRIKGEGRITLYAFRNRERWERATEPARAAHFANPTKVAPTKVRDLDDARRKKFT